MGFDAFEQPRAVAVNDGAGRQHFRVKPRAPSHEPVQIAAMPIRPIHHRRDGKAPGAVFRYPIHSFNLAGHGA
jgi:hypothetical protein